MRQHSSTPEPKWNRWITRRIFPPDSETSSGNETGGEGGTWYVTQHDHDACNWMEGGWSCDVYVFQLTASFAQRNFETNLIQ